MENNRLNLDGSRIHALVGQNGSGKTRTLKAFALEDPLNVVYRLEASSLPLSSRTSLLSADGRGLVNILHQLSQSAPRQFDRLQERLRYVIPAVRSVEFQHDEEVALIFNMDSGDRLLASNVSDGTLMAFGILGVIMTSPRSQTILLDNVERSLHPRSQQALIWVFRDIVEEQPDRRIIFATHSPYMLDSVSLAQVHVFAIGEDGLSYNKRLDEHPSAERGIQTLTTGEFWDAEGEEWVVSG